MLTNSRAYIRRAFLVPAVLIAYPVLALLGPTQGRDEFYPFFRWNLFSYSSDVEGDSVIFVKEINGKPLSKPTLFYDMGIHFAAARLKDTRLAKMLDNLVRAEWSGNRALSDHLSNLIEATFMSEEQRVKYEVAVIKYSPIRRYRTGEILAVDVVRKGKKVDDSAAVQHDQKTIGDPCISNERLSTHEWQHRGRRVGC